ncbi:MAG TPA: acyltransferase [Clostridiales bacterium]|nr:acyltransferase [Clostridiales bacterium]HQK72718.1 acyltransferase [Clostridiales bacterium]
MANYLQNKQYYGIDIMKLVMSVFVIAIHRPVFAAMPAADILLHSTLTRQAVPYFFTAAAFLFFGKAPIGERVPGRETLSKYVRHILLVYLIWSAVYFPVYLTESGVSAGQALREYAVRFLYCEPYLHLWFLPALVCSTALIRLLLKKMPAAAVAGLSFAAMLACRAALWAGGKNGSVVPSHIDSAFFYLLFTAMGAHIARHNGLTQRANVIGLTASLILLTGSNILAARYAFGPLLSLNMTAKSFSPADMPVYKNIFIIPLIYFLFCVIKNIRFKERKIYTSLRPATSLMYLSHLLVTQAALSAAVRFLGVQNTFAAALTGFGLALAFTLALSFCMVWLEKRRHFHWMKSLH